MRLAGSSDSGWLPNRLPGRLNAAWIALKHHSGVNDRLLRVPAGAHAGRTCRAYVLRPANQLRRLVRFTDQMAATGMRNDRSHSRSQMRIDTSCDVAKLAVKLAEGRVLEPERGFNPFIRSSLSGQRPAEHSSRRTPCRNGQNGSPPPAMTHLHMA